MTESSRLLDFFTLEASEYLSRLEAGVAPALAEIRWAQVESAARGLRGSATMARVSGIARAATALERAADRASRREIEASESLRQVASSSVESLRLLVRGARGWGAEQDAIAERVIADLRPYAPDTSDVMDDVIVPISELFYAGSGPHIVEVAPSARASFEQRLRERHAAPAPPRPSGALRGAALREALGSSLAEMRSLERPGEPAPEAIVPIQSLLYRGQAAVQRARELRAMMMAATSAPPRDVFAELCDLVELAGAE